MKTVKRVSLYIGFLPNSRHGKIKGALLKGCILNPGHGKIPAPDFNFYIQKDKYPI